MTKKVPMFQEKVLLVKTKKVVIVKDSIICFSTVVIYNMPFHLSQSLPKIIYFHIRQEKLLKFFLRLSAPVLPLRYV